MRILTHGMQQKFFNYESLKILKYVNFFFNTTLDDYIISMYN